MLRVGRQQESSVRIMPSAVPFAEFIGLLITFLHAAPLAASIPDDECAELEEEGSCVLSVLQRRGRKTFKLDEATDVSAVYSSSWGLGRGRRRLQEVSVRSKEASKDCSHVTAGTCKFLPCLQSRGQTDCVNGQCLCREGYCANSYGICVDPLAPKCIIDEAITTCRIINCPSRLGGTVCSNGQCFCLEGFCYNKVSNVCEPPGFCSKDTGGICTFMGCNENRGPSLCIDGRCACPNGFCARDNGAGYGVCELQATPMYLAKVAAVNQERPKFPNPHNIVVRGISFSGGGSRALSNTLGALRALEDLGLMPHVDAISSVSGGSWASSIYMFAEGNKEALLGRATKPGDLSLERLAEPPAELGRPVTTSCHSFLKRVLAGKLPYEKIWQLFIGETILAPFGLNDEKAFMAGNKEQVSRIKAENPQLKDATFITPRSDRPKVFVMNGALLSPLGFKTGPEVAVSFQMSPDFTGSPFWPNGRPLDFVPSKNGALYPIHDDIVGGGMLETFAFGGGAPNESQSAGGRQHVTPPLEPFTLAHAVGISSDAPGGALASLGQFQKLVPQASIWPVTFAKSGKRQAAKKYALGDGGNIENSGLLALLQRGARKAVMWVSTYIPLKSKRYPDLDFCNPPVGTTWERLLDDPDDLIVAPMVSDKFGFKYKDKGSFYTHNQVFAPEDLPPVLCKMYETLKAGKPIVHRASLDVLPNKWWGIKGGHAVDLVIVYLEQSSAFEAQLPESTRLALGPPDSEKRTWTTSQEFARFPRYKTTRQTEESTEVIRLTNREVNLLAAQSEFAVRQNEQVFREVLCPDSWSPSAFCCRNPLAPPCKL